MHGFAAQLREASRSTGVSWAVWLQRTGDGWEISTPQRMNKSRRSTLQEFLGAPQANTWLAGALAGGHTRSRSAGSLSNNLGCTHVYAFPSPEQQGVLLVGDGHMGKAQREFFRILALGRSSTQPALKQEDPQEIPQNFESSLEALYDPNQTFSHVLHSLAALADCRQACLAIRFGDCLRIESAIGYPEEIVGREIALASDGYLERLMESRQPAILEPNPQEQVQLLPGLLPQETLQHTLLAPIIFGKHAIGILFLADPQNSGFHANLPGQVMRQLKKAANSIESAMVFTEAVRYLQQFALLNDLALATSGGQNPDEVARRVVNRLSRSFNTDQVAVLLLSQDGKTLQNFGYSGDGSLPTTLPVEESLAGYVVENSKTMRVGDISQVPRFYRWTEDVRSALFAPMRYQGEAIGVVGLQSEKSNAFTLQDEQLLNVIASHLAGLIENARLNLEARERANKLTLIHKVVQRVVGLRDEIAIAKEAAELVADYFDYEITSVLTCDETSQYLSILGVGGSLAHLIPPAYHFAISQGIAGKVFRSGRGGIFNDVSLVSEYLALPGWRAGSEMCVPMFERERVFGLINVESARKNAFSDSDYIMLEALAGILSSVMVNARRYRELKQRIDAQELAENRLVRSARLAAVGEMAAGVAHELNNPLTTVLGFLELALSEIPANSQQRSDLELAAREAQRAREVVRRLLDFSHQSANIRERTNLNVLMEEVLPLVVHQLQTGDVRIHLDLAAELPPISVNANQIKQVILNLLQNALQAMPEGGEIRVRSGREMRTQGLGTFLKVCDTGEGIPPENYERIFEPFFTTRSVGQGTGLGLSVSYGIITSHGGHIEVDSVMGRGSCFNIWLPVDMQK